MTITHVTIVKYASAATILSAMVLHVAGITPWNSIVQMAGAAKRQAHIQLTGQMFNMHIDKLWDRCYEDPERVARITIMLDDWQPGHFYIYGNCVYSHWRAGEVHIFDWANVPHATSNASNTSRAVLQITGLKTDRTREVLATANKDSVFKLA